MRKACGTSYYIGSLSDLLVSFTGPDYASSSEFYCYEWREMSMTKFVSYRLLKWLSVLKRVFFF